MSHDWAQTEPAQPDTPFIICIYRYNFVFICTRFTLILSWQDKIVIGWLFGLYLVSMAAWLASSPFFPSYWTISQCSPSQLLNAGLGNDYSGHHHGGATDTGLVPIPFWIIIRFSIPCSITQNRMGTRLRNRMSSLFKYTPHFLDRISTFTLFIPLFFPLQWLYLLSRPSPVVIVV